MWELNRAERRAFAGALLLLGTAGFARTWWSPSAGDFRWRGLDAPGIDRPMDAVRAALDAEARAQTPLAEGERIDVSAAPSEELRRLPGVGPALAAAIIRTRAGRPFVSVRDLENVPGIGPATLAKLEPHVRVSGAGGADSPGPLPNPRGGPGRGCPTRPDAIDVNRASARELEALPGVGPALAARIIELRAAEGRFETLSGLERVRGIGPSISARIVDLACVG